MLAVENNLSSTVWFGRTQFVRLSRQTSGGKQYSGINTCNYKGGQSYIIKFLQLDKAFPS